MNFPNEIGPIQFITTDQFGRSHEELAKIACSAGIRFIQYREKTDPRIKEIKAIQKICETHGATLIVDDHIDLALKAGASGVHLGQEDEPIREARKKLGKDAIIGGTANTMEHIKKAAEEGADYIGLGPYRPTASKKKLSPVLGLEGYQRILGKMKEEGLEIPVLAIGGIETEDIQELFKAGVSGIALSSAIAGANDPEQMAKEVIEEVRRCY